MLQVTHEEAHFQVNNFAKVYPNGKIKLFKYKTPFYKRIEGFEETQTIQQTNTAPTTERSSRGGVKGILNEERSLRRSKTLISDIVLCTEFDMFATFTFKKDRQDISKCKRKMIDWLKSQQKFHGKFQYLIVPEFHKDGKSIHFHALLKNYKGNIKNSGKKINNRTAYNITSYRKGFTSLIKIDNIEKVSSYIKKYITKDMPTIQKNKQRFWCSKNLKRPTIQYNLDLKKYKITEVYAQDNFTINEAVLL